MSNKPPEWKGDYIKHFKPLIDKGSVKNDSNSSQYPQ